MGLKIRVCGTQYLRGDTATCETGVRLHADASAGPGGGHVPREVAQRAGHVREHVIVEPVHDCDPWRELLAHGVHEVLVTIPGSHTHGHAPPTWRSTHGAGHNVENLIRPVVRPVLHPVQAHGQLLEPEGVPSRPAREGQHCDRDHVPALARRERFQLLQRNLPRVWREVAVEHQQAQRPARQRLPGRWYRQAHAAAQHFARYRSALCTLLLSALHVITAPDSA
eukprot:2668145-Rhodomonas_salina.2